MFGLIAVIFVFKSLLRDSETSENLQLGYHLRLFFLTTSLHDSFNMRLLKFKSKTITVNINNNDLILEVES